MAHCDNPALNRVTHALAGVAGSYGLAGLEAAARALAASDPADLDADAEVQTLAAELDRAEEALRTLPQTQAA